MPLLPESILVRTQEWLKGRDAAAAQVLVKWTPFQLEIDMEGLQMSSISAFAYHTSYNRHVDSHQAPL
jgi:hypothetical protein